MLLGQLARNISYNKTANNISSKCGITFVLFLDLVPEVTCESTFLHELSASATRVHAATNCNENYGTPDRVGTVGKMSYKEISLPHEVSRPGGPGRQSLPFAEPFA